jgi:serine protease inhibitor
MTRSRCLSWIIALAAGLRLVEPAAGSDPRPDSLPEPTRKAVERQNALARSLLKAAADAAPRENVIVAPLGIAEVLDITREAAAGETAKELDLLLGPAGGRAPLRPIDPSRPAARPKLSANLANNDGYGVKVIGLADDTPEARAGVRAGDLIFALDGRPARSRLRLEDAVGRGEPGRPVALQVFSYDSGLVIEPKVVLATETTSMPGLSMTRALWIQSGAKLSESFRASARDAHGFALFEVDFKEHPDVARGSIDAWLAKQARGGTSDPSDVGPDTRLIFIDGLALQAAWARPFPEAKPGEFRTLDGSKVATAMMRQEAILPHVERKGFQALELPFRDARRSFTVILTKAPADTLPEPAELSTALGVMKPVLVDVILPRFTLETSRRIDGDLALLGVKQAFSDEADFPGFGPGGPWKLGAIRQSVKLEVAETGVKAEALTTAAAVTIRGERAEPRAFHADRPFLFVVVDRPTGLILLVGRKVR